MSTIQQLQVSYVEQFKNGARLRGNASVKRVFRMVCKDNDAKSLREFNYGKIDVIHHIYSN